MPSTDPVYAEMVDVIAESLFSMDPQRAHVIACFAAQAVLARWPHIAGPERVESVEELDALPDGSIVLDAEDYAARVYRDAHELTEVAYPAVVLYRPDTTNPEEGTR